jgi:hypothetical protein
MQSPRLATKGSEWKLHVIYKASSVFFLVWKWKSPGDNSALRFLSDCVMAIIMYIFIYKENTIQIIYKFASPIYGSIFHLNLLLVTAIYRTRIQKIVYTRNYNIHYNIIYIIIFITAGCGNEEPKSKIPTEKRIPSCCNYLCEKWAYCVEHAQTLRMLCVCTYILKYLVFCFNLISKMVNDVAPCVRRVLC